MRIVHQLNRIPRHYSTTPEGGVDLCMEPTNLKGFFLPTDSPHDRAREVDERKKRACRARHRRIEVGEAAERRTSRLSDQENNH
jgi:hypothetical protein